MQILSLEKIHWCLLKFSSGNENTGVSWADNSVKNWRNLPISNPKPDLHNINAHIKFGENPLMFTQVIIRKGKTDGRTTDGHTDDQRETIIPRHYCVAGYKNTNFFIHIPFTTCLKIAGWMTNNEDSEKIPCFAASDLFLHCLFWPVWRNA